MRNHVAGRGPRLACRGAEQVRASGGRSLGGVICTACFAASGAAQAIPCAFRAPVRDRPARAASVPGQR
jgi:hypothetical protein